VLALVAIGVWQIMRNGGADTALSPLQQFRVSLPGRAVLGVFNIFGRIFTSQMIFPELAVWTLLGATINVALIALAMRLDADYAEASVIHSQKMYERIQRARRGGLGAWNTKVSARRRLPVLPWLGGAGPIAWRQMLTALRNARGFLILALLATLVAVPTFLLGRMRGHFTPMIYALAWMSLFLPARITFPICETLFSRDRATISSATGRRRNHRAIRPLE